MDYERFLQAIRADRGYRGQVAHVERLPARPAHHADPAQPLTAPLPGILSALGIERLYAHQARAVDLARAGRDTVIVTSTASGKTLCYNLPVLEDLLAHPHRRALYLYPTKALAQDQHKALRRLLDADPALSGSVKCGVYDGDTPQTTRRKLRDEGNVVLSNPDMLHSGILPYHTRWARFWANLGTVVIDEVHTYRGIFGSNVANLLRRLRRVCDQYGSNPRFVCCSATIANPVEHASRLVGRELALVDNDGSPKGEKLFVFWNPPHLDEAKMQRASSNVEAERLMVELIRQGVQTIAFGRARIVAELLYRYVREQLQRYGPRLANAVKPYRGGYLAAERREIEQRLFNGELLGVTSTNALELGIDIGGLDAAIIVGFPGTVASTWQQAGRAGRGTEPSVVFFIGYNEPVDQFIMRRPEYILGQSPESAVIDPENPYILAGHLSCAAAEMPLRQEDARYFGPRTVEVAEALAEDGQLRATAGSFYWAQPHQPSHKVGLRTVSDDTYTIIETTGGNQVIGQVDAISAPELVYEEAVYIHAGQTHFVERLDTTNKVAYVRREDMDYYTQAILESSIQVKGTDREKKWGELPATDSRPQPVSTEANVTAEARTRLLFGEVDVTWATIAFKKIQFYSTDSLGWTKVDLPPQSLSTMGTWLIPSLAVISRLREEALNPVEALSGLRNAAVHLLPLYAMCDKQDIGGMVDTLNTGMPTLFLYDRYAGGVGFAETAYDRVEELMQACLQLILDCDCREGCPSCVGVPILRPAIHTDPDAGGGFPIPHKTAAIRMLQTLLEEAAVLLPDG
jgi:DEAD/DEAH box helicase domain-containing protein